MRSIFRCRHSDSAFGFTKWQRGRNLHWWPREAARNLYAILSRQRCWTKSINRPACPDRNAGKNYMAGSSHSVALWNMELQLSERLLKIILVSAEREVRGGCGESGQEDNATHYLHHWWAICSRLHRTIYALYNNYRRLEMSDSFTQNWTTAITWGVKRIKHVWEAEGLICRKEMSHHKEKWW